MRQTKIFYWIVTGLLVLMVGVGAIPDLMLMEPIVQNINRLGYPTYLIPFLGVMKLLAVVTILVPALKRFREGAYAGLFFYATGAIYSHLAVGDPIGQVLPGVVMLVLVIGSYLLRLKLDGGKALVANQRQQGSVEMK